MFNSYVTNYQRVNSGFPKWGIPKSPWVSILDWSNDLDDLGLVLFEKTSIWKQRKMNMTICFQLPKKTIFFNIHQQNIKISWNKKMDMGISTGNGVSSHLGGWAMLPSDCRVTKKTGKRLGPTERNTHSRQSECFAMTVSPKKTHQLLVRFPNWVSKQCRNHGMWWISSFHLGCGSLNFWLLTNSVMVLFAA